MQKYPSLDFFGINSFLEKSKANLSCFFSNWPVVPFIYFWWELDCVVDCKNVCLLLNITELNDTRAWRSADAIHVRNSEVIVSSQKS